MMAAGTTGAGGRSPWGRLRGAGGGRSLVVNGHIDVVDAGDALRWTSPPFEADVRDGRIYGRGAVDMKGGIGAALFALEALHACGVRLAGDVVFETVPDEETCAMGTVAAIARGYRADAGSSRADPAEPLDRDARAPARNAPGRGRSAHAEMNQPHWRDGGGVNAIQKAAALLAGLDRLTADWADREDKRHPPRHALGQPDDRARRQLHLQHPERCDVALNATYLPGNADESGYGSIPRSEIEQAVAAVAAADDWLAEHRRPGAGTRTTRRPRSTRAPRSSPSRRRRARPRRRRPPEGIDTTYDGALLTLFADTPSPAFGPGDLTARTRPTSGWGSTSSCSARSSTRARSRSGAGWPNDRAVFVREPETSVLPASSTARTR